MTYTTEDTGDQLHALRIRANLEQSELAALTSNSVGTPKPMLWERRAPARQKTMIMCKSGGPHTHAASTYSIIGFAIHYFYYLVSTTSWVESNCFTCGKEA